MICTSRKYL